MPLYEPKASLAARQFFLSPRPYMGRPDDPEFTDVVRAAFERENAIVSGLAAEADYPTASRAGFGIVGERPEPVEGFTIKDHPQLLDGYEDAWEAFTDAESPEEVAIIKRRVDRERKNADILARGGFTAFLSQMAAGTLDPINLIPVMGGVKRARQGVSLLRKGKQAGAIAATFDVALASALGNAIQEIPLQETQATRENSEIFYAAMSGAALGGMLGGAAHSMSYASRVAHEATVRRVLELRDELTTRADLDLDAYASLPAEEFGRVLLQAADDADIDLTELFLPKNKLAAKAMRGLMHINPTPRLMKSESPHARLFALTHTDTPIKTKATILGETFGIAAETELEARRTVGLASAAMESRKSFDDAINSGVKDFSEGTGFGSRAAQKITGNSTPYTRFREAVGKAVVRGHAEDYLSDAAKKAVERAMKPYKEMFGEFLEDMLNLGALGEVDIEEFFRQGTAPNHLMRVYDLGKLRADPKGFEETLARGWAEQEPSTSVESLKLRAALARDTIMKLTPRGHIPLNIVREGTSLKARQIDIPDELLEPWLVRDIDEVARRFVNTHAGELAIARRNIGNVPDRIDAAISKAERRAKEIEKALEDGRLADRELRDLDMETANMAARDMLPEADQKAMDSLLSARDTMMSAYRAQQQKIENIRSGVGDLPDGKVSPEFDRLTKLTDEDFETEFSAAPEKARTAMKEFLRLYRERSKAVSAMVRDGDVGLDLPEIVSDVRVMTTSSSKAPTRYWDKDGKIVRPKRVDQDGMSRVFAPVEGAPATGARDVWVAEKTLRRKRQKMLVDGEFESVKGYDDYSWTTAHELGHVAQERMGLRFSRADSPDAAKWTAAKEEWFAESFALRAVDPDAWHARFGGAADEISEAVRRAYAHVREAASEVPPRKAGDLRKAQSAIDAMEQKIGKLDDELAAFRRKAADSDVQFDPEKMRQGSDVDMDLRRLVQLETSAEIGDSALKQVGRIRRKVAALRRARYRRAVNLTDTFAAIQGDYIGARADLTDPKKIERLDKQMKEVFKDVVAIRDRLIGDYGIPDDPDHFMLRAGTSLKRLNFVRLLGNVTISSMADIAMPIFVNGMEPFREVMGEFVKNPSKWINNMNSEEILVTMRALEYSSLHKRSATIADIIDNDNGRTMPENLLKATSDAAGKVFLIDFWNGTTKQISGFIAQHRIIKDAIAFSDGRLGAKKLENLVLGGVDLELARNIAEEWKAGNIEQDGAMYLPRTQRWSNQAAARKFESMILRETRRTILTPGVGDLPKWMSDPVWSLLGQFKSFGFTALNRVTISGLQRWDAASATGTISLVGMGMFTYALSQASKGKPTSDDWRTWIIEGVDRSGVLGTIMDVNNMMDRAFNSQLWGGVPVSIQGLVGADNSSRYSSRTRFDALLGPTFGAGEDVLGAIADPRFKNIRRIIPFQNHFLLRRTFDALQD